MSRSRKTFVPIWAILLAFSATPKLLANSLSSVLAQSPTPSFTLPESLPSGATVTVSGTSSMTTVNQALKQRYQEKFPNAQVELNTGSSDQALEALQNGEVEIAAVGRPLTEAEKAAGLVAVPVDRGKIAIVVGRDNPFNQNLTFEQFAGIFRGEITDWSEVGGEPGPIRLVDRPDFSDTRRALSTYDVFKAAPFEAGSNAEQVSQDETEAVIEALGADGIGYAIADDVIDADNVTIVSMHQTFPDDPRYPYSQIRTYVYQTKTTNPATLAFLGFATSEPGQEIVAATLTPEGETPEAATTVTPVPATKPGVSTSTLTPGISPEEPISATDNNGISGGVISPEGATNTETAIIPDGGGAAATTDRKFPGWLLWLLAIPLLGAFLWWFLKGRGGEPAGVTSIPPGTGATATATPPSTGTTGTGVTPPASGTAVANPSVLPVTAAGLGGTTPGMAVPDGNVATPDIAAANPITSSPPNINLGTAGIAGIAGAVGVAAGAFAWSRRPLESRVTLAHQEPQSVDAVWNIPQADIDAARQQGGQQLQLRVYDVTDLDLETDIPQNVQQYDCDESTEQLQVPVPQGDRNYISEVGYIADNDQWLPLCRSNSVYVPASETPEIDAGLSLTPPSMDVAEIDTPEVGDLQTPEIDAGLSLTPPSMDVAEIDTPEVGDLQTPEIDAGLSITPPSIDVPEVDTPEVGDLQTPDTETPTGGVGLPGMALGGAALVGAAAVPFLGSPQTQLSLTPGDDQTIEASWNIPQADMDAVKQQGGQQLQLRVYDVTALDLETDTPESVQQYDCDQSSQQLQVPVPQGDRNYAAAIGYVTRDNQWLPLCCSESVYVPVSETPEIDAELGLTPPSIDVPEVETPEVGDLQTPEIDAELGLTPPSIDVPEVETPEVEEPTIVDEIPETETPTGGVGLPGMALGGAVLAGAAAVPFLGSPQTQLSLTPGDDQTIEASWNIPQADMDAVKQQGGQQLQLRVYDVTDLDLETDIPQNVQQYDCDELTEQLQVPVPQGDRNYAAAIGYVTRDNQWLPLCCSDSVYLPVLLTPEIDTGLSITSPSIDVPEIETPEVGDLQTPEIDAGLDVTSPLTDVPEVETPEVGDLQTPEVDAELGLTPPLTDVPEVETPEVEDLQTPEVDAELGLTPPSIDVPEIETPEVGDLQTPDTETPTGGVGLPGMALGGAVLAGAAAVPFLGSPQTQLSLTPGDDQTIEASWNIPQADMDAVKQQGGQQLQLRVYDMTDLDLETDTPQNVQQYDCDELTEQLQVPVPQGDRNYAAAIGYVTRDNQWLPLCCSDSVYVPVLLTPEADEELGWGSSSPDVSEPEEDETSDSENPPEVEGLTSTGLGAAALADTTVVSVVSPPPSQLNLVVIADQMLEASWDIPQADIDAVKQQGGQQLQLRVYDVTDVDLQTQTLDTIQQYDCDESSQQLRVRVLQGDREYAAAIGYVTDDTQWLPLCCSDSVYVAASQPLEVEPTEPNTGLGMTQSSADVSDVSEVERLDTEVDETPDSEIPIEGVGLTGIALGGGAAAASLGTVSESSASEEATSETTPSNQILQDSGEIHHLTVHSRNHCFLLNDEQMAGVKETAVSQRLEPGIHIVRIKSGTFGYGSADSSREPIVLLWIYGGKVINKKTNVPVESTWSSLNGYHETLTLEVLETSTLCAFFFDMNPEDNYGELTISVVQLYG